MCKVLWVDASVSSKEIRSLVIEQPEEEVYTITLVPTVQAGLRELQKVESHFDIVICDREIPLSLPHQEMKLAAVHRDINFFLNCRDVTDTQVVSIPANLPSARLTKIVGMLKQRINSPTFSVPQTVGV